MQVSPNAKALLAILVVVVVPAALTLGRIDDPALLAIASPDPTPLGYTFSLLIYVFPIVAVSLWFSAQDHYHIQKSAYRWTLLLLIPLGFLLDLGFGNLFLNFPNQGAHIGLLVPGYSFEAGGWVRSIPIEEFVFYTTGFMAILLIYIWCDEYWLAAYNVTDYGASPHRPPHVLRLHWRSGVYGLVAIVAAILYKKFGNHEVPQGFPGYFTFLVLAAVVPALVCFRAVQGFINWRAVSLTLLWVLLTSHLWEATIAIPYGWWGYNPTYMMGVFIRAWHGLPIEAVLLWLTVTFTTVIVYESVKVVRSLDGSLRQVLIGRESITAWLRALPRE